MKEIPFTAEYLRISDRNRKKLRHLKTSFASQIDCRTLFVTYVSSINSYHTYSQFRYVC